MIRKRYLIGFPINSNHRFRLGGHRYPVGVKGVRTLTLLLRIYERFAISSGPERLHGVRGEVREVQLLRSTAVLSHVVACTSDPAVRIISIWLRGRCGGTIGTSVVARFSTAPDQQTRKEVARALKRMSAWGQLANMATNDRCERVRRIAATPPSRPFGERLAAFSMHASHLEGSSNAAPMFISPGFEWGQGQPPKSPSVIRTILQRIRQLVARVENERPHKHDPI